jgi:hypothetical protein
MASLALSSLPRVASASVGSEAKVKVLGWGFDEPEAMAVDGQDFFVANEGDNTVTELALPTMTLVRVIHGPQYQFSEPGVLAVYGPYLWVLSEKVATLGPAAGAPDGILTEVDAATGQLVQVLNGPQYGMDEVTAMTIDGPDLFVVDAGANQLTEVDASTGRLVGLINSPYFAFAEPRAITSAGPDVFVANDESGAGGTVTEFDAATGALVQLISGAQYRFRQPEALAAYGPDLFVLSPGVGEALNGSITEVDTNALTGPTTTTTAPTTTTSSTTTTTASPTTSSTTTTTVAGSATTTTSPPPSATVVRVLSGAPYSLGQASTAAVVGNYLYVANVLSAPTNPTNPTNPSSSSANGFFGPGSLERIDAQSGVLVGQQSGGTCHTDLPDSVVSWGDQILVSNIGDNTISELGVGSDRCAGATLGSRYQFDRPAAMVVARGHLFVGGETPSALFSTVSLSSLFLGISFSNELTEMNPSTGALTRVLANGNYHFGLPGAFAASGADVFVANVASGSITELDASTGGLVRVISLGKPGAVSPTALVVSGAYLFAAVEDSKDVGSLREIDIATGRTLRTISGKHYQFATPLSLAADGPDLFVDTLNDNNSSGRLISALTEVDIGTGKLVRVLSGAHISQAVDVLAEGPYVFVLDLGAAALNGIGLTYGAGSLAQIDAKTGALVRVISGSRYDIDGATVVAALGHDLYVADTAANAVTEIDSVTGALIKVFSGSQYDFAGPDGEATWGEHLYVANGLGDSVTDIQLGS